jgi:hypothetical protein
MNFIYLFLISDLAVQVFGGRGLRVYVPNFIHACIQDALQDLWKHSSSPLFVKTLRHDCVSAIKTLIQFLLLF